MTPELHHSREFSNDKLYMWRTIIAIAHVDGDVCVNERGYLESVFDRMRDHAGLEDDQRTILLADLDQKQDAVDMLSHVEDIRFRGQIMHFAQMLAAKDGVICEKEQALIDRLHEVISKDMNVDPVDQSQRQELLNSLDDDTQKSHGRFVALVENFLSSTGIKG